MRVFLALWLLLAPVFAWASAPVPVLFGGQPYVLDTLSAYPAVAYSVRQLTAGPNLPAYDMTVRRASDSQQMNIGFSGGWINTAQITSFCAATNCYVVTWKNQGSLGSSGDATQSTAANQPQIVANGVVETWNGQPTVYFGGSQFLATAGNVQVVNASTGVFTTSFVTNSLSASGQLWLMVQSLGGSAKRLLYQNNSQNKFQVALEDTAGTNHFNSTSAAGNLVQSYFNGSLFGNIINGVTQGTASLPGSYGTSGGPYIIGAYSQSGSANPWLGTMSEIWDGGFVQSTTDKSTYDLNTAFAFNIAGVTQ